MHRHLATLALASMLLSAGCSGSPEADAAAAPAGRPGATEAATAAPLPPGRAIEISATDTMKFSVTEITARRGERLSVTLVNDGTTPKFSMGHNWVLLVGGTDVQQFILAAAEAVTTDYVPAAQKAQILASTKLLGPKEHDTVTFTAPATAGRYDFLCSFPGHFQVGMRGVLIVE